MKINECVIDPKDSCQMENAEGNVISAQVFVSSERRYW